MAKSLREIRQKPVQTKAQREALKLTTAFRHARGVAKQPQVGELAASAIKKVGIQKMTKAIAEIMLNEGGENKRLAREMTNNVVDWLKFAEKQHNAGMDQEMTQAADEQLYSLLAHEFRIVYLGNHDSPCQLMDLFRNLLIAIRKIYVGQRTNLTLLLAHAFREGYQIPKQDIEKHITDTITTCPKEWLVDNMQTNYFGSQNDDPEPDPEETEAEEDEDEKEDDGETEKVV